MGAEKDVVTVGSAEEVVVGSGFESEYVYVPHELSNVPSP